MGLTREDLETRLAQLDIQEQAHHADLIALKGAKQAVFGLLQDLEAKERAESSPDTAPPTE